MDVHTYERELVSRYRSGRYLEALSLARLATEQFPENGAANAFWVAAACIQLGRPEQALSTLEHALDHGVWWSDGFWKASVFDVVRREPRYLGILERSEQMSTSAKRAIRPSVSVLWPRAARPRAIFMALHGRGAPPTRFASHWSGSLTERGFLLALPTSTQLFAWNVLCWDDSVLARREIVAAHQYVGSHYDVEGLPTVLAGYSQGADMAVDMAVHNVLPSCPAYIAVCPTKATMSLLADVDPTGRSRPSTRVQGWITVGAESPLRAGWEQTCSQVRDAGLDVALDIADGSGDEFPPNFDSRLDAALRSID